MYKNRRASVKQSEIIHIAIKCGACGVINNHTGSLGIYGGECHCAPDTLTCMCDLAKKLHFQCPDLNCKYSDTIEIY